MVDASLSESLHDQDWIRLEKSFLSDEGEKTDFSVVLIGFRLPIMNPSMAYLLVVVLLVVVVVLLVVVLRVEVVVVPVVVLCVVDVVLLVVVLLAVVVLFLLFVVDVEVANVLFSVETNGLCGFNKPGPRRS